MNILFYLTENRDFMYSWQRLHIFNELEKIGGHNILTVNLQDFENIEQAQNEVLKTIRSKTIDLFMTGVSGEKIADEFFHLLSAKGIPSVLICYDNLHAPYSHLEVCGEFDLVWLTSGENQQLFKKRGANTIHLPYAANPVLFKPKFSEEIQKLCFVGSLYGTRLDRIKQIVSEEVQIDIFSKNRAGELPKSQVGIESFRRSLQLLMFSTGRKMILGSMKSRIQSKGSALHDFTGIHFMDSLNHNDMILAYSNYAMVLNVTELRSTLTLKRPIHKLHLRTFEIPMCGGIQFAPFNEELSHYYDDGKEIIMYSSDYEMKDKAAFYSRKSNFSKRKEIRRRAVERSRADHTWTNRFNSVFNALNL